jgi:hypothetical protein
VSLRCSRLWRKENKGRITGHDGAELSNVGIRLFLSSSRFPLTAFLNSYAPFFEQVLSRLYIHYTDVSLPASPSSHALPRLRKFGTSTIAWLCGSYIEIYYATQTACSKDDSYSTKFSIENHILRGVIY